MGSGNTKDKQIDIYLQVTKPFHFAGEYVEGFVYINAKNNCSYANLFVRLEGQEYVYWTEGSGKDKRYYTNNKKTYTDQFILTKFQNGVVPRGHYTFPFSFLLPQQMTGSFFQSAKCYIRYSLSGYLTSSDGKNDNQMFSTFANILQPFRGQLAPSNNQEINSPKCCGCCKGYGKIKVGLSCDKNNVKPGDQIFVQGYVDNSMGKKNVQDIAVRFKQNRIMIASTANNRTTMKVDYIGEFFKLNKPILPGQTQNFFLCDYSIKCLNSSIGCCSTGPYSNIHLVFTSSTPKLQMRPPIEPPSNWCPVTYPGIVYNNMKPFLYDPSIKIPYKNRGYGVVGNLQNMNMGYFNNNMNQAQNQAHNTSNNFVNKNEWESNSNGGYAKFE